MEPIYIRLKSDEAINSKRSLLSAEINFLNIIKKIQSYRNLRNQEFTEKKILRTKLKKFTIQMKKLKTELPKAKIPEIEETGTEKAKKMRLEDELKEIREKLARLS